MLSNFSADRFTATRGHPVRVVLRDNSAILLLTIVWLGMVVLVNPVGNFPLNDDWAYGWSVKILLEKGDFQLSDWTAVNLLSQVFWGSLFCLPFGFSFTALRFSTLFLGLIGVLAIYGAAREVKASPGVALAGALTVALNPIYFALSHSFMSDVPSFAFTTGAFYLLIRALNQQSLGWLVAGVAATVVAILNRQVGLIIVPAFAAAYLTRNALRIRSVAGAILISLPGLAAYLIYPRWLAGTGRTPHLYDYQTRLMSSSLSSGVPELAATYAQNAFIVATYVGLFMLPFTLMVPAALLQREKLVQPRTLTVLFVALVTGLWTAKYWRLPSIPNVLGMVGVGRSSIAGTTGLDVDPLIVHRIWQVVTILAVVGAGVLLLVLLEATRAVRDSNDSRTRAIYVFALAMVVLFLIPIGALPRGYWFDRYLVVLLPPLMVLTVIGKEACVKTEWRYWRALGVLTYVIYGLFAVTATHDYLSWSRSRWKVLNMLVRERHIPPQELHGGFEFNGWFSGQRVETCNSQDRKNSGSPSWADFPCISHRPNAKYRVATGPRKGYTVAKRYTFRRWLPPVGNQAFYLLRHDSLVE